MFSAKIIIILDLLLPKVNHQEVINFQSYVISLTKGQSAGKQMENNN